jgi:hypothetical protein
MKDNTTNFNADLMVVQRPLNTTYHKTTKTEHYDSLFGVKPKRARITSFATAFLTIKHLRRDKYIMKLISESHE